ncbi:hypothetical protein TNCV_2462731 [Trichonephila clavipes]|nr:hypothetical protein TNCV_2462731 [Trichonephila clavipes]
MSIVDLHQAGEEDCDSLSVCGSADFTPSTNKKRITVLLSRLVLIDNGVALWNGLLHSKDYEGKRVVVVVVSFQSCQSLRQVGLLYNRRRHHLSPPPQFRHGTGGEGNIFSSPLHPGFLLRPTTRLSDTDLTSTYSVCTRRLFGGIGHRTQVFQSAVRYSNH